MAKGKQEEAPKGSPAWMSTFSDLMNLLLCFFVLLFSMSTVDVEKFEQLVAALQSSFSILPSGGTTIGEGEMISSGISQLQMFDDYFNSTTDGEDQDKQQEGNNGQQQEGMGNISPDQVADLYQAQSVSDSERMAEEVEQKLISYGLQDQVEVEFNAQYVLITMNGAILFKSGSAELMDGAKPIVDKLATILEGYQENIIEIEGHTDNVPQFSADFESNDVLSMYRALNVADYIRGVTTIKPSHIKSAGRGEYVPIADNGTPEGRARNRRVEIKLYNSYNSDGIKGEN